MRTAYAFPYVFPIESTILQQGAKGTTVLCNKIARMGSAVLLVCLAHTHTHEITFNMTDLV